MRAPHIKSYILRACVQHSGCILDRVPEMAALDFYLTFASPLLGILLYFVLEFQTWLACVLCFACFLGAKKWKTLLLLIKTAPRDIRWNINR